MVLAVKNTEVNSKYYSACQNLTFNPQKESNELGAK